jgi:restriction system protein
MTQRLWLIRLGKFGEDEAEALSTGQVTIDFRVDLQANLASREACLSAMRAINPDASGKQVLNWAAQLNQFWNQIAPGDLVVIPLKTANRGLAIGKVESGPLRANDGRPTRRVKWMRQDTPRSAFKQDLLYSFGAIMTVCEVKRNDAVKRTLRVAEGVNDAGWTEVAKLTGLPAIITEAGASTDSVDVDLATLARDQIEKHIASNFVGHGLTALIADILRAQGFALHMSPPGADGGYDIVCGRGALGFDSPRMVVQVKSGDIDQPTLQSLIGCVQDAYADQGLLVSWGGFKPTVLRRVNELYFRVRLWGRTEILEAVFANYDRLSEDVRARLPLRRSWLLVPKEEAAG